MSAVHAQRFNRRRLLQAGAAGASLGAVLAACGGEEEAAPGRVGYAPPATPLPTLEKNDIVWLRTATSIEHTVLDVYSRINEIGGLDDAAQTLVDRFVADHTEHAAALAQLTVDIGGEPYECANQWYLERDVEPMFTAIVGDEAQGIAPSDDAVRDMLAVSNAYETLAGAMYQQMVGVLTSADLRREVMTVGAHEARHASAMAMKATGVPEGYVSPIVLGQELTPDETGLFKAYAIPTQFGSLAAIEVVIGARSEAGTRPTFAMDTPADNSLIYEDMTC